MQWTFSVCKVSENVAFSVTVNDSMLWWWQFHMEHFFVKSSLTWSSCQKAKFSLLSTSIMSDKVNLMVYLYSKASNWSFFKLHKLLCWLLNMKCQVYSCSVLGFFLPVMRTVDSSEILSARQMIGEMFSDSNLYFWLYSLQNSLHCVGRQILSRRAEFLPLSHATLDKHLLHQSAHVH